MREAATRDPTSSGGGQYSAVVINKLTAFGIAIAFGTLVLGATILFDARRDAWRQAEQASANLTHALERDIARNIAAFEMSLQGAIAALQQPALKQTDPEIRQMALFDRTATAEFLGSLLVLAPNGNVLAASTSHLPPDLNLVDRDYFRIHQERPDAGLYLSRPFQSRLRGGDASIAISHRIPGPGGEFGGVVMGALRLAFFKELFGSLNLGPGGSVTLLRADGRIIARHPFREADIDRTLSGADTFQRFSEAQSGQFVGMAALDGVRRHYTFRRFVGLPLILSVAVAVDDIYAAWWRKALSIGTLMVTLCGATVALCLLFRRELLRRLAAEKALTAAAEELSRMAATDGLTGLANRRRFDLDLEREWRRAARNGTPISLLLLDADCFKAYNDLYGHQEGDEVLRNVASSIRQAIRRPADTGARYGGEEFALLLPETDLNGALGVAEGVRSAVAACNIPHRGNSTGHVTVSIGVATARPAPGEVPALLLKAADEALYEAKRGGRNRVVPARSGPVAASGCSAEGLTHGA